MEQTERQELLDYFTYEHLPPHLQERSKKFHDLAHAMAEDFNNTHSHEVAAGLRKLLEAKDCFVRAALKLPKSE